MVVFEYLIIWTLIIITELKYFELWFRPNELLLLVGRVVTFGIRANNQPKMCSKSRLSLGAQRVIIVSGPDHYIRYHS